MDYNHLTDTALTARYVPWLSVAAFKTKKSRKDVATSQRKSRKDAHVLTPPITQSTTQTSAATMKKKNNNVDSAYISVSVYMHRPTSLHQHIANSRGYFGTP